MRGSDNEYGSYQNVNPFVDKLRMRLDMHIQFYSLQSQSFKTGSQSITVFAWSEIPAVLSPHIPKAQLHFHVWGTSQELGQMSKVERGLEAKAKVGGHAVHLEDEQLPVVEPPSEASGATYRYIEHDISHHLQLRPRNTVERLQLLQNRRSHKQRLWEPERVLSIENTRRLIKDLLVGPKQRRISRSIPLKLHCEGSGREQSEAIDAVPNLPRQGEEWAVPRHLPYERASRWIAETQ